MQKIYWREMMKIDVKRMLVKAVISVIAVAIFLFGYYFVYLYCGYQRIEDKMYLDVVDNTETEIPVNEELTLVTHNIGFGAYSDDYSFFMDGGEYGTAISEEAVESNLTGIIETLKKESPDLLLLQEVDIDGTRSYHIDQTERFSENFAEYDSVTAINYDSPYFFYPFHDPIGKNKSGMMTMSKYSILNSKRRSLPVEDSLYKYFDLDRAYSVTTMETTGKKVLMVYNVHLSAYTSDGTIADEQLKLLLEDMKAEYDKGRYVIAAGDFNKDLLGDSSKYFERREGDFTWAKPINTELIPEGITLYATSNAPSCRNADSPYRGDGTDFVLTVDGMLASDNVTVVSSETIDAGFSFSDHNPVKYKLILEDETVEIQK